MNTNTIKFTYQFGIHEQEPRWYEKRVDIRVGNSHGHPLYFSVELWLVLVGVAILVTCFGAGVLIGRKLAQRKEGGE